MKRVIDLRSDTVTKPSDAMRKYMYQAEVGDDVFGEDRTVNKLQERVAEIVGKERGLFVVSGTLGNEIALKVQTQPGDGVILDTRSHIVLYECGAPAVVSGVQLYPVNGNKGIMTADQVQAAVTPLDVHVPRTKLICLENTHNKGGGVVYPLQEIQRIRQVADRHGLRMHLDGARLWNAVIASGVPAADYARYFDSVMVCLSKGLGAPIGSVLTGSKAFIEEALRVRKLLGGGWRQAGILAAAGIYALEHNVVRLQEDHDNAKLLWLSLKNGVGSDSVGEEPETNILIIDVGKLGLSASAVSARLAELGVLMIPFSPIHLRIVTHLDVSKRDCEQAAECLSTVLEELLAKQR